MPLGVSKFNKIREIARCGTASGICKSVFKIALFRICRRNQTANRIPPNAEKAVETQVIISVKKNAPRISRSCIMRPKFPNVNALSPTGAKNPKLPATAKNKPPPKSKTINSKDGKISQNQVCVCFTFFT